MNSKLSNHDMNKVSCAIYLDLSKAFDTVERTILLKKLEHYGIHDIGLTLIENYLSNRKQCVLIDGVLSDILSIDLGVPNALTLDHCYFSFMSMTSLECQT